MVKTYSTAGISRGSIAFQSCGRNDVATWAAGTECEMLRNDEEETPSPTFFQGVGDSYYLLIKAASPIYYSGSLLPVEGGTHDCRTAASVKGPAGKVPSLQNRTWPP